MTEQETIKNAIESAKARKYYVLSKAKGGTHLHQERAEKQAELQNITICALEKQIPQKPLNVHPHVDHKSGNCPCCEIRLAHFGDMNYCHRCGIKLDWEDAEDAKQ